MVKTKLKFSKNGLNNEMLSVGFNFSSEELNRFNEIERGFITYLWTFEKFDVISEDLIKSIEERKQTDRSYFEYNKLKLFIYYDNLIKCIMQLDYIVNMFDDFENFVRVQCRFYNLNYLFNYKKYNHTDLLRIKRAIGKM